MFVSYLNSSPVDAIRQATLMSPVVASKWSEVKQTGSDGAWPVTIRREMNGSLNPSIEAKRGSSVESSTLNKRFHNDACADVAFTDA